MGENAPAMTRVQVERQRADKMERVAEDAIAAVSFSGNC